MVPVTAFLALCLTAGSAAAEDPLYLNWSALLPGLTSGYDPSSANDCKKGSLRCVDSVIREMTHRFDDLADDCNHDSMFALAYLRTTEQYRVATTTPGFFEDPSFVNHEDAVFARYYFDAYDAWHRGDVAATPPAWRIAFAAADQRKVTGDGNVLLGISAHINRDLPFVLWEIGLVKPDGSSRKPDHDRVNGFLNQVSFYPEAHARFDDSMSATQPPGMIHTIIAWREQAWRNAERLQMAERDPVQLALVKASIESFATTEANLVKLSMAYPLFQSSAARDAYCAVHHDDA
jgi:hypothetical protein